MNREDLDAICTDVYFNVLNERQQNILQGWGESCMPALKALAEKGQTELENRIFAQNFLEINALNSDEGLTLAISGKSEPEILALLGVETLLSLSNLTIAEPPQIDWLNYYQKMIVKKAAEALVQGEKALFTYVGSSLPEAGEPAVTERGFFPKPTNSAEDAVNAIFSNADGTSFDSVVYLVGYIPLPESEDGAEEDSEYVPEEIWVEFDFRSDDSFASVISDYSAMPLGADLQDTLEPVIEYAEDLDSKVILFNFE
jgi:hypothetical protein